MFTTTEITGRERQRIKSKSGGGMWHVVLHYRFRFYAEDGSYVTVDQDGEAMDSGDKAANKCASIAHKYALLTTFCIATEDLQDPDASGEASDLASFETKDSDQAFEGL